jgi:hypothetical protein
MCCMEEVHAWRGFGAECSKLKKSIKKKSTQYKSFDILFILPYPPIILKSGSVSQSVSMNESIIKNQKDINSKMCLCFVYVKS